MKNIILVAEKGSGGFRMWLEALSGPRKGISIIEENLGRNPDRACIHVRNVAEDLGVRIRWKGPWTKKLKSGPWSVNKAMRPVKARGRKRN